MQVMQYSFNCGVWICSQTMHGYCPLYFSVFITHSSSPQLKQSIVSPPHYVQERVPPPPQRPLGQNCNFLIQFRTQRTGQMFSQMICNEDRAKLLALTGNVVDESVKTYGDDGVSQQATVKSGVTSVASVKVPNPEIVDDAG